MNISIDLFQDGEFKNSVIISIIDCLQPYIC